ENPRSQEFSENRLPGSNGLGEQKFDGTDASFLGPKAHTNAGNEKQIEPGMPHEERIEVRLAALEEVPSHEGEKPRKQQKNDDKHIRDGRRKVSAQLAFGYRFDFG